MVEEDICPHRSCQGMSKNSKDAIFKNQFGRLAQVEILHNILQQMGLLSFSTDSISASPKW